MIFHADRYIVSDISQILFGDAAMALCFFTPGYFLARATDVMAFRLRSLPEKILWSISLSGPSSILLTCIVARWLPMALILALFLAIGLAAIILFLKDLRANRHQPFGRAFWMIAAFMVVVAIYCILATVGIQTSHSLHESIVSADWSIRVPLVEAAVRWGLPPHNPMFAAAGVVPPMRYYYFWYELCALIIRIIHVTPRAALTATTAWSAYSLLSVLLLTIKYLGTTETVPALWSRTATTIALRTASLRYVCVIATGLTFVMSLDLIAAICEFFSHPRVVFPDIEAWQSDRMPSWAGAILFAPHHVAGVAFGCLGFLLLAVLPSTRRQRFTHACIAAGCFAALVGTSTYLSICIAIAGFCLLLIRMKKRQWSGITMIMLSTFIAVIIASPFLREMATSTGYSASEHVVTHTTLGNSMFKLVLSNWHAAYGVVGDFSHHHGLHLDKGPLRYVLPLFVLPFLYLMELSFYVFVIWYQFRKDFLSGTSLTERALLLWSLFLGFALSGLFLSSAPIQGINDLERHAGLALRLVLIAWAAPMLANVTLRLRAGLKPTRVGSLVIALSASMIFIGIGGEIWQITMDRAYFALVSHGLVQSKVWFGRGAPFLQIRRANEAIDANTASDAIIQANPDGPYEAIFLLYGNRQTAAGDQGCESAFGGNIDLCKAEVYNPLHALFGGTMDPHKSEPGEKDPEPANPANMTRERFAATCAQLHLNTVIASKDDAAWGIPGTWVYTQPALYADDATRVISCPR